MKELFNKIALKIFLMQYNFMPKKRLGNSFHMLSVHSLKKKELVYKAALFHCLLL